MARVLLAEDDDSMRTVLARALTRAGHRVTAVADGGEAVARLAEDDFDLLLADSVMPAVDGVELANRAAARSPAMKIMLITGFAAVAVEARDALDPGTKLLSKPFHPRTLVDEVDKLLAA